MRKLLTALLTFLALSAPALAASLPSVLTLTSTTTAYTAGQFIASNSNGTLITVPSFTIQSLTSPSILLPRLHLVSNDTTAASWNGQTITIDLWTALPTFAAGSGDRSTFSPATGTGSHFATYTCLMSTIYGDGSFAECSASTNSPPTLTATSPTTLWWTATATTGSGTTGASKTLSLTPEAVY